MHTTVVLALCGIAAAGIGRAQDGPALLQGMNPQELQRALDQVEKVAAERAAVHDCDTAVSDYEIGVAIARTIGSPAKEALYFRRMGLCRAEQGRTELALEVYRQGIAAAEKTDDIEILAENLHGAAVQLGRFGRYREALPVSEREYALTLKCGHPDHQLRALFTYSSTMAELGHYREALVLGQRAVEVAHQATQPNALDLASGNLAMYYAYLGDLESGLRIQQSLVHPNARDMNATGVMEKRLHRYAEAERAYAAALAQSSAPVDWRTHDGILYNLGELQKDEGKTAAARSTLSEVRDLSLAHQDLITGSVAVAELSRLSTDEKDADHAMSEADEALRLARESGAFEAIGAALVARGRALDLAGRGAEADEVFGEAISMAEAARAEAPASAGGLQGEVAEWLNAYQFAVDHRLRAGNALEALRLADRAKARVLLDMIDGGEPGLEAFTDPAEQAEEEKARAEVATARHAAIAKPGAASKSALETALRNAEDVDLRLYARHPELVLRRAPAPDITSAQLAQLAEGRTAILSYFVMPDSVALFVIRKGAGAPAVRAFRLPGGDKLEARIKSFRDRIAARDIDYRTAARELFDALIAPAATALNGSDRWIISPDGALWDVPFQALVDASGKHVIESHALTFAPSLATLRQLRETRPAADKAKIPLLAIANPSVKGVAAIPEAERESRSIAALYGLGASLLLSGDKARPTAFRENAGSAAVIHIASHAETEPNHPLESFLLLTPDNKADDKDDGAVTARDILGLRLRADLVVLSACETARGKVGQGEGILGLGWAVLAAGARATAVSQWKVDSDATSDLMIGFHRRLTGAHPMDKAEALRQSSLAIMRSPGRRHPFYWASFMVIGDSR